VESDCLTEGSLVGKQAIVHLLLDNGADIRAKNKWGESALYLAAKKGRKEVVQLLVDGGGQRMGQRRIPGT
jgi:ankyrin repeat protein